MHNKYKGTIALSILSAYNHLHESLKLFISTLLLSIGITPILYISGSFYGMMFFVAACVSFIFLILLFVRKLRGFFISSLQFFLFFYRYRYPVADWQNRCIEHFGMCQFIKVFTHSCMNRAVSSADRIAGLRNVTVLQNIVGNKHSALGKKS